MLQPKTAEAFYAGAYWPALLQPPPDPRLVVPNLADHTAQAIVRAMSKQPGMRYNTAAELVSALALG